MKINESLYNNILKSIDRTIKNVLFEYEEYSNKDYVIKEYYKSNQEDFNYVSINRKQIWEFFDNGYGISIVRNKLSYTSENILDFEIAVLKKTDDDYEICYDTPITNDVIGYLTPKEVSKVMKEIQELPKIN